MNDELFSALGSTPPAGAGTSTSPTARRSTHRDTRGGHCAGAGSLTWTDPQMARGCSRARWIRLVSSEPGAVAWSPDSVSAPIQRWSPVAHPGAGPLRSAAPRARPAQVIASRIVLPPTSIGCRSRRRPAAARRADAAGVGFWRRADLPEPWRVRAAEAPEGVSRQAGTRRPGLRRRATRSAPKPEIGSALDPYRPYRLLPATHDHPPVGEEVRLGESGVNVGDPDVVDIGAPLLDRPAGR